MDDGRYTACLSNGVLELRLKQGNLFAWSEAELYRYIDASVEAEFDKPETGSAGLMLHMTDESSFVYVLVSAEGSVRLDAVFNGEPRVIVPWIACPWLAEVGSIVLTVVMRGSRYLILANGRWALEADDDSVEAGRLAFVARLGDVPAASFRLRSLRVESRPLEVEVDFTRYGRVLVADDDQRRRVAEGLFSAEAWLPALLHTRKLSRRSNASPADIFMEAECLIRMNMFEEAETLLGACLATDPDFEPAREEHFNLMYLQGRYLSLKEALLADSERVSASPRLQNLLGHAQFNLGAWEEAATAYGSAADADPSMPIYRLNLAESLEKSGRKTDAAAAWLQAARSFFQQQAWNDAGACSTRLRELKYDATLLDSLDARVAYGRGDLPGAERLFAALDKKKRLDAPCALLYGLIRSSRGEREKALELFRLATVLDPEPPIYRFRLAEALFLLGRREDDEFSDALESALERAPDDGWILNLEGLAALASARTDRAVEAFRLAAAVLPEAPEPAINLSHALAGSGRIDEALDALGSFSETDAAAANQRGNILVAAGRLEAAEAEFARACALAADARAAPEHHSALPDYLTNLAGARIELGRWSDAEDSLRKALSIRQDARAMMLMGDVAQTYGDAMRAETAYRTILQDEPRNAPVLARLARSYLMRNRFKEAAKIAEELSSLASDEAIGIQSAIRAATTEELSCASCGRLWTCPKPVPHAPRTTLRGEPPAEAPAGSCPNCGKTFCVGCRSADLREGRFVCPECGVNLNLNDDRVRWLVRHLVQQD